MILGPRFLKAVCQVIIRDFALPSINLNQKSVLVTGGTGSFGMAFVDHVLANWKPKRLIVFSRDEQKQYEMAQRLRGLDSKALRFFIGDVRDLNRLEMAMRDVDIVVHAAALKHISTAEYNPFECIKTNVVGAQNIVEAALQAGVKQVIALSTDKAANPTNLYGASKLAADKIFVAANNMTGPLNVRFSVVRYGNVACSRGSVIPYFQQLIAQGADSLPITDKRMTRFWITLPQAVNFVLSSLAMMRGGEIFVPKIPSMRVADMARAMAPNLPLKTIGIRPGEKLHEVLITEEAGRDAIELPDRYIVEPAFAFWSRRPYLKQGATVVPEGLCYASDSNTEWLSESGFHAMLSMAQTPQDGPNNANGTGVITNGGEAETPVVSETTQLVS